MTPPRRRRPAPPRRTTGRGAAGSGGAAARRRDPDRVVPLRRTGRSTPSTSATPPASQRGAARSPQARQRGQARQAGRGTPRADTGRTPPPRRVPRDPAALARARGTVRRRPTGRRSTGRRPPTRRRPRRRLIKLGDQNRRLRVGLVTFCALLLVLGGRLVQLQGFDSGRYAKAAISDRIREFDQPAQRGQILDRDGNVLAYSVDSRIVYADPTDVENVPRTAAALAPSLNIPEGELEALLTRKGRYVELARDVEPQDAEQIMDLGLRGVGQQLHQQRIYPARELGANILGFTNHDGAGAGGVEARFDDQLSGTPGKLVAEVGDDGQVIPSGVHARTEAVPGSSVRLTLSEDMQYVAQTALDQAVREAGAEGGQLVALSVKDGEVLAMAVSPSHDPQDPEQRSHVLTNPAVSSVFEPGSANKVVTFAAAVEHGVVTPETVLAVPGSIKISDRVVHDAWSHGLVRYTATGVLAKSSNVGTLMIAQQLGPETFNDYMHRFGLGARTGIELPGESAGILPAMEDWSGSTFGNLPIGQGVSMTTLQLASMYQTIANGGVRVPPRIVRAVVDPSGATHPSARPESARVVSAQTAQTVRQMLEAVTHEGGTAPKAAIDGYRVAGKTGTAQQPDPTCHCYTNTYWSTFAGMAPADDPQVVIAIMLDGGSGGKAARAFKQVMTYALKQRRIPPTGSQPPAFRLIAD